MVRKPTAPPTKVMKDKRKKRKKDEVQVILEGLKEWEAINSNKDLEVGHARDKNESNGV